IRSRLLASPPFPYTTLFRSGAFFDAANGLAQRIDFSCGVELRVTGGIVIVLQFFGNTAVAHADNVAGRKMHQPGVIALSQKVERSEEYTSELQSLRQLVCRP